MADVLKVITDSYEAYRDNWKKLITAFVVIFLFALILGIIQLVGRISQDTICKASQNTWVIIIFCLSPLVLQYGLGIIGGLLNTLITMAVIEPIDEIESGKTPSDWTKHFSPQLVNAILVMILRFLLTVIIYAPLIVVVIVSVPALVAFGNSSNIAMLLGGGLLMLVVTLAVCTVVWSTAMFLLTFLEVEVVLGGHGALDAGVKSARLVRDNLWDVLIFSIAWYFIRIAMGVLNILFLCTCVLIPLMFVIDPFIVEPIELMSKVMLWRRLKKSS